MPKTDHFRPGRNLPTEKELRIYMESLKIDEPYRLSEDIPSFRELYEKGGIAISLESIVISDLFYNQDIELPTYSKEELVSAPGLYPLGSLSQVPSSLRDEIVSIPQDFKNYFHQRISNDEQLRYMTYSHSKTLKSFRELQGHLLVEELKKSKLVAIRSDPEIREEIELRKKQYPNQKIYLFIGYDLCSYYSGVNLGKSLLFSPIISSPTSWGADVWGRIGKYESAIVAQTQVRARHSLHSHYEINRIPRYWNTSFWAWMKFAVEVDPREEDPEVINDGQIGNRFSSLDI